MQSHNCEPHGGARGKVRGSPNSLQYIIQPTLTSVQECVPVPQLRWDLLDWITENFYLLAAS